MSYKIIITGGGTGGHIFPAVAIANALKAQDPQIEILFVGAHGKMEMEKVPAAGYDIRGIDIAGYNRSNPLANLSLPYKLWKSNLQAKKILKEFHPDAVIGVGGYASFPVMRAAQKMGIPTFLQEQNAFAGKTNQWLGRMADTIFVSYDNMEKFFPKEKYKNLGNPIRKSVFENLPTAADAKKHFGLNPEKQTIAVVGGSLGAQSINKVIAKSIPEIVNRNLQLIWQTGASNYDEALQAVKGNEKDVVVLDFVKEIGFLYQAADVIISRAGAGAIAELSIVGKPVVFVPYPYAAEDHQKHNAQRLVGANAAALVLDKDAQDELMPSVYQILEDQKTMNTYSKNIQTFAVKNADDMIANTILTTLKNKKHEN